MCFVRIGVGDVGSLFLLRDVSSMGASMGELVMWMWLTSDEGRFLA